MTRGDFMTAVKALKAKAGPDPLKWQTTGLERTESGRFNDDDLARVLAEAVDEPAGAFGARHVPAVMRIIDTMGIDASRRDWAVCTMKCVPLLSRSRAPPSSSSTSLTSPDPLPLGRTDLSHKSTS